MQKQGRCYLHTKCGALHVKTLSFDLYPKISNLANLLKINRNLRLYLQLRHVNIIGFLNILTLFVETM